MLHAQSAAASTLRRGCERDCDAGPASRSGPQPSFCRSLAAAPSKRCWQTRFVASAARGRGGVDNGQRSLVAARRCAAVGPRPFAGRCAAAADAAPQSGDEGGLLAIFRDKGSKLIPMCALFFFMAFCNSVLDSTKDTLMVTALGGAEQIPFLTVYAVLPASVIFVVVFSHLSNVISRNALFNATVIFFLGFFALFTGVLFPLRHALEPHGLTEHLLRILPAGAAPGVAIIHNWTYTLFYVAAELWGDIVLSLLFWGLANDITRVDEAHVIYPLFGLGANVAQGCAGLLLRWLPSVAGSADWDVQLRLLMTCVLASGAAILALQLFVARRAAERGWTRLGPGAAAAAAGAPPKPKLGMRETFKVLATSPQMLCLAAMSVAQGLASNVFQVAWKRNIRELYPGPVEYSGFMGDVTTVSAIVTGLAMLLAPLAFSRLGWSGAAAFTPLLLLVLGWAFFGTSVFAGISGSAASATGGVLTGVLTNVLPLLVVGGAVVYVFEKAAKFSLFKPAEEMVYLGLDDASRTKGKAAVDVCATQLGKAGGSLFQQGLLVTFGTLAGALPALAATHSACVGLWLYAVQSLAHYHGHLLGHVGRGAGIEEEYTSDLACDLPPAGDRPGLEAARRGVAAAARGVGGALGQSIRMLGNASRWRW